MLLDASGNVIQAIFGMEKRAAVKDFISLTDSESQVFWKNYDEYEAIRKELGRERVNLLDTFANQYETMTDKESIDWMKSVIFLRERMRNS